MNKDNLLAQVRKLLPEDLEVKGWEILEGGNNSCCPGDDAGFGYEKAILDVIELITKLP